MHLQILINGQHFASFEHRIVYHRATHLAIDGDIVIENIEFRSNGQMPTTTGGLYPPMPGIVPNLAPTSPYPTTPGMPTSMPYPQYPPSYGQVPTAPMTGNIYSGHQYPYPPHVSFFILNTIMFCIICIVLL